MIRLRRKLSLTRLMSSGRHNTQRFEPIQVPLVARQFGDVAVGACPGQQLIECPVNTPRFDTIGSEDGDESSSTIRCKEYISGIEIVTAQNLPSIQIPQKSGFIG